LVWFLAGLGSSPPLSGGASASDGWWVPCIFTNHEGTQIGLSAPSGKTQAWPWPHNKTGLRPCQALVISSFHNTCGKCCLLQCSQCFSAGVKLYSEQFKNFKVKRALLIWVAGELSPPSCLCSWTSKVWWAHSTIAWPWGLQGMPVVWRIL
jgi:hypothetical protein